MNNLELGFKAHQEGQLQKAQQYYLKHLSGVKNDANALQLLGLINSALGDIDTAIVNMKRSLSINSAQPNVFNNLGVCQKKKGLFFDAKDSFERAIDLKVDYLDPYKNLIRLLLDTGYYTAAKSTLEQADSTFPNDIAITKLNADYNQSIENYSTAISLYETLLVKQPDSVPFKHSLALSLRMAGQPSRALELYNELEQTGLSQFQFFHNKANTLSDLGHLQAAVDYYRKAIEVNPAYVDSHLNLNDLLWELGDNHAFLKSYQEAFTKVGISSPLGFSYTSTLLRVSQFQAALNFLDHLPAESKNHYQYFDFSGRALKGLGKEGEAIEAQARVLTFDNVPSELLLNFAETLIQAKQYQRAEEVIENVLRSEPESMHGWALLGVAWQLTGDPREAILNDYDNLVREYAIEIPEGYDDIEQFCRELNGYLATLHTANRQPLHQTLKGGTQSRGNLFDDSNPIIKTLIDQFKKCITDYIQKTEPLIGRLPIIKSSESFHFSGSWSVRLKGEGIHTQHIHPMGWLSSAFYVQLPPSVEDDKTMQGWLKFGEPNFELPNSLSAKKHVQPVVGKLVLFQSYMWHGTNPFNSDNTRTTIAFDVAPGEDPNHQL